VTKPFRFAVLLARVRAQLRQYEQSEDAVFTVGPYQFKPSQKLLTTDDGKKIRLTEKEAAIIRYLYRAGSAVVTRDVLLEEVWGYNSGVTTHTLPATGERQIYVDPAYAGTGTTPLGLNPFSVQTGQTRVENFLRSSAVFNIATYPQITFRSKHVVQDGPRSALVEGILTARGVSRPETFHATFMDQQKGSVTFHVTGNIPRTPYGMGIGVPLYSNTVAFDMDLKGVR
jgi:hypothetical protein